MGRPRPISARRSEWPRNGLTFCFDADGTGSSKAAAISRASAGALMALCPWPVVSGRPLRSAEARGRERQQRGQRETAASAEHASEEIKAEEGGAAARPRSSLAVDRPRTAPCFRSGEAAKIGRAVRSKTAHPDKTQWSSRA